MSNNNNPDTLCFNINGNNIGLRLLKEEGDYLEYGFTGFPLKVCFNGSACLISLLLNSKKGYGYCSIEIYGQGSSLSEAINRFEENINDFFDDIKGFVKHD